MALAYVKPGVTVSEIVSPSFSPILLDPTSICIVGPGQGYEDFVQVFVLDDNTPIQLGALNVDTSTIVVRDASNVTLEPFRASTTLTNLDYNVDSTLLTTQGIVSIVRAMQTTIGNGESVVVYFENSGSPSQGDGKTESIVLNGTSLATPAQRTSGTVSATVKVGTEGLAPVADYAVVGAGGATPTIVWVNTATVLRKFQTVYLDYTVGAVQFSDIAVQLNNLTPVNLPTTADNIVVKTAPGTFANTSALYQKGTTTDLDYILTGTGATLQLSRSAGTTTIGASADKLAVRVSYRATPSDYWLPTRCFGQSDVEDKFGPAYDSVGNILNPVSFAASVAFENGAASVIVQALFTEGSPRTTPTGSVNDWEDTLKNLRDIEDVNVIVPIIAAGNLVTTVTDSLNLQILQKVQDHVNYMAQQQQQLLVAIVGEDGTGGALASKATLQAHAQAIGARTPADSVLFVSPSSFNFANPVTGVDALFGGQYVAAAFAGALSRYPVQTPMTRKRINVITSVNDSRTETDKDADAQAGLTVIEAKRGTIQVRHAITTATDTLVRREFNVVRAKQYMMENIRESIDTEVIGQIVLDDQSNFRVQLIVTAVLERLRSEGALVSYQSIQVRRNPSDASALEVRFSYLPAYPLNQVSISFSIDSAQGVTFDTTDATNVQGI